MDIDRYCNESRFKYCLCAGLPHTDGGPLPMIQSHSQITRDILDFLWLTTADGPEAIVPLFLSEESHRRLRKQYEAWEFIAVPCEYCGSTSHHDKGRCDSCGAPFKAGSSMCAGGYAHQITIMPRYHFDPIYGYVKVDSSSTKWVTAQFEAVCIGHDDPAKRSLVMTSRVAAFIMPEYCY